MFYWKYDMNGQLTLPNLHWTTPPIPHHNLWRPPPIQYYSPPIFRFNIFYSIAHPAICLFVLKICIKVDEKIYWGFVWNLKRIGELISKAFWVIRSFDICTYSRLRSKQKLRLSLKRNWCIFCNQSFFSSQEFLFMIIWKNPFITFQTFQRFKNCKISIKHSMKRI